MSEPSLDLSVIIPVYNEEESVKLLLEELHAALDPTGSSFELVLVDDGSSDRTWTLLEGFAASDPSLYLIQFRRNFGQTAAMQAGLDAARGRRIVTMDADLQNDPADIPALLQKLDEGYDLVAGWRKYRKDPFLNRKLPSMIANRVISIATKVKLHDYGCTLKAMTSVRAGAAVVTNSDGKLAGIFTHGDFVRHFQSDPKVGERLVSDLMTLNPVTIQQHKLAVEVLNLLERHRIDDLIVIDNENKPVGIIDAQDLTRLKLL